MAIMVMILSFNVSRSFGLSSSTTQVQFIKSIDAGTPISVAVDAEGRIYAGQNDGTVKVMIFEGLLISTLEGRDDSGRKILGQPAGLAVSVNNLYIADRSNSNVVRQALRSWQM